MKQWSYYGIGYVFNSLKTYSIAASETLRLVVVFVMVSFRWSILLIFLVFFIIVELLLSMHMKIISRVARPHRIIEPIAINGQIEDAGRNICCLCGRTGSRRHSAYACICCWPVVNYKFLSLPVPNNILTHGSIGEYVENNCLLVHFIGSRLLIFCERCTANCVHRKPQSLTFD